MSRVPVFRVSGRVRKDGRTCRVEVVAKDGTRYTLRQEFAGDISGVIAGTRIVDMIYDAGTINPEKWVRVGVVDELAHEGLLEAEGELSNPTALRG